VVDDHLMGITHVMRGMEYLSSTPKYNLLYEAFGWEIPKYVHLTPIMRDATHKLSKRDGDASYADFREKGYLMGAIVNYIALLGWNPGTEQEKFTIPELIEAFSLKGLSKSPAIFDPLKMKWLNGEYIRARSPEQFGKHAEIWDERACVAQMDRDILNRLLQPRVEIFSEIPEKVAFLVERPPLRAELFTNKKNKVTPELSLDILPQALNAFEAIDPWSEASIQSAMAGLVERSGLKTGAIFWPVRVALSGLAVTPGGPVEIAALLGREESLKRLASAIAFLKGVQTAHNGEQP